jgi:hypothetical protein
MKSSRLFGCRRILGSTPHAQHFVALVMAKRTTLANPTTCATGITGAGGGVKSGLKK